MIDIQLVDINKTYRQGAQTTKVLQDINLHIEPGEFFFLLGPSGCGKTTLLRIIAGLLESTSGKIYFDDKDMTKVSSDKRNCAMVFQNYALWPHMTVNRNVEFGPQMKSIEAEQRKQLVKDKLTLVQMAEYGLRKPNQLSGGQQQRVALARALAADPGCLLLDEPLSNLDARLRAKMRVELRQLVKSMKTTAIYVTHDQKEALTMADRIAVLKHGKIVQVGPPEEVYSKPKNEFVADFIGEANFITGRVIQAQLTKIKTDVAGEIISNMKHERRAGDTIQCCIRPEKIQLYDQRSENVPETNRFSVTIREIMYFGDLCQIEIELSPDLTWKTTAFSAEAKKFTPGQTVYGIVSPDDVILLSE